ncbi:hypothetical protein RUM44_007398 [Polyplax serrata]|uniref:Uncharacterized protein n=1 Tax=Polyplax serrata TaxID=468196 RepID=A0ABR1B1A9_POLSC
MFNSENEKILREREREREEEEDEEARRKKKLIPLSNTEFGFYEKIRSVSMCVGSALVQQLKRSPKDWTSKKPKPGEPKFCLFEGFDLD